MKFILTKELGRLVKWLRILGYDSEYFKQDKTSSLFILALRDERIIVTRNQRLSQPRGVKIIVLKAEVLKAQLGELLKALNIALDKGIMFSRCSVCNTGLKPIEKQEVKHKVPAYVYQNQEKFTTCPACQRIYWQGTHWGNVSQALKEISLL
jgi:uncharacterized protein with PIN domain